MRTSIHRFLGKIITLFSENRDAPPALFFPEIKLVLISCGARDGSLFDQSVHLLEKFEIKLVVDSVQVE